MLDLYFATDQNRRFKVAKRNQIAIRCGQKGLESGKFKENLNLNVYQFAGYFCTEWHRIKIDGSPI